MMTTLTPYEQNQRKRTLTIVIWAVLVTSLLLTLLNIRFNSILSILSLAILDLLCVVALVLNYRGYYPAAALFICSMILVAITFNLYDGDGLFDPGVVAYPILIILGTMLLGKRSVLGFSLATLISLFLIGYLQSRGLINVTIRANDASNLIPILIFIVASGLMIWVIMSNMEENLARIKKSEVELRQAYEMTLYGWAKALEYRDKETEGHSRRVVQLSQRLAQSLGCGAEETQDIRWGAILHDIGKMGVPDHILLKPGPLDPEEWEIMRQHPRYGLDMLAEIDFLQPAIDIVGGHHEYWDGSGYPQGLKGQQIPFAARLFTIVDNWDALNSDRPYRKAWSAEAVETYMRANAGKLFDPDILTVFLQMDKS